jgi:hypothetical protein
MNIAMPQKKMMIVKYAQKVLRMNLRLCYVISIRYLWAMRDTRIAGVLGLVFRLNITLIQGPINELSYWKI